MLYLLFFASGISSLIYQVVWVRVFANVFGNTIYSASIVVAVFMFGLGIGSAAIGRWADRRYAFRRDALLPAFGAFELGIGVLGFAVSLVLPHLGDLSAAVSAYTRGADGWYVLSTTSYVARTAIALVTLLPITLLMGGTLTLLIRHAVHDDVDADRWRIALLYGVNTFGAATGCLLTDYALVPALGLRATQIIAAAVNIATACGAVALSRYARKSHAPNPTSQDRTHRRSSSRTSSSRIQNPPRLRSGHAESRIPAVILALALTGFAAMGMEIVWFRQFSILLGEFRAVFSLLLAIILAGLGAGALAGGYVQRRTRHAARAFAIVEAVFIAATLLGLALADARAINAAAASYAATHASAQQDWTRAAAEIWFNARPILMTVGVPAVAMGFAYPLANAIVQDAESVVGWRAGVLYLANTIGAVCGSLAAGFLLLPRLGMQGSATVLMLVAAGAVLTLVRRPLPLIIGFGSIAAWMFVPSDYMLSRALLFAPQRAYTVSEGVTELVAVTDGPDGGRVLVTNGHPMSSTELMSQRYMRAMAHVPLLLMDHPQRVLVICYGVGNTANAATLHPSVTRVDVVDLSRHVLEQSGYFKAFNGDVLHDPRVAVYVNDGRQHLQMQAPGTYDLITLEPPPIVHAGVAALYTTEFYESAKRRLARGGYLTQWLPAFGVPQSMILSMARSFVDVFPNAVLLSGASSNLLLVGTNGGKNEIDPDRLAAALAAAPEARADLQRIDLGTPREIVGMFVASSRSLARATRASVPVTDDRPIQEYGKQSLLDTDEGVPPALVDLSDVASWCPRCVVNGAPAPSVAGLDTYLALLNVAYAAPRFGAAQTVPEAASRHPLAGSGYLGAVVPDTPQVDAIVDQKFGERYQHATALLVARRYSEAIDEFRDALRWNDRSAEAHNNLGIALASTGHLEAAIDQFKQALAIDPGLEDAAKNLEFATAPRPARPASAATP